MKYFLQIIYQLKWTLDIGDGENESEVRPMLQDTDIPSTSFSTNLPEVTNDGNEVGTSRPSEKFEKATGFVLYDSYRSVVDVDDDAMHLSMFL